MNIAVRVFFIILFAFWTFPVTSQFFEGQWYHAPLAWTIIILGIFLSATLTFTVRNGPRIGRR